MSDFTLQNPLLRNPIELGSGLTGILEGPTQTLARATRPDFLGHRKTPVEWGRDDWERMEAEREDLLDLSTVTSQFDREKFLRDGFFVFRQVMTAATVEEWSSALEEGQRRNDALLTSDWSRIDWHKLGRLPPETSLARIDIEGALGGSQKAPQSTDEAGVQTLREHSLFTEYFPAGHIPYLMNVLTHPHMLHLQRLCLGAKKIYFDHNQLLTRPPGYAGCHWHSHRIGGGFDDCGSTLPDAYDRQPNANLTICYPRGFEAGDDGGLKVVAGSHLFRDPTHCRATTDEELSENWLCGRRHPVTGEPLQIEHLALPSGSIVCCLSHAAHGVAPKGTHRRSRLCALLCYKKADDASGHAQPASAVPPVWALKAKRGELPPAMTQLLRLSFDREITAGRLVYDEP